MDQWIEHLMAGLPMSALFVIIAVTLVGLAKGADWLVDHTVILSERQGIPKVLIGATVVSLGTTTPEAAVSVLAAVKGDSGLALGNAVGSMICDTGLILGLAALINPPKLDRLIVNRQGWLQLAAGFLLVIASMPFSSLSTMFADGGNLPQVMGFVFVALLVVYLWMSIRWTQGTNNDATVEGEGNHGAVKGGAGLVLLKLVLSIALVVASSYVLIPAVKELALRVRVPDSIIAATLVAFGTSLPELVTAVTAVRRGHGELAVGNVIGADILNVLFVAGAAASVTPGGLAAPAHFFRILFPGMLAILIIFRLGIALSKEKLGRPFGVLLLLTYLVITILSYVHL